MLTRLLTADADDTPRTDVPAAPARDPDRVGRPGLGPLPSPVLEQALEAGREVEDLDVMGNLGNTALHLGHDEGTRFFYSAMVSTAREAGAGMVIIYALRTARVRAAAHRRLDRSAQLRRRGPDAWPAVSVSPP